MRRTLAVVAVFAACVLSACGDDDSSDTRTSEADETASPESTEKEPDLVDAPILNDLGIDPVAEPDDEFKSLVTAAYMDAIAQNMGGVEAAQEDMCSESDAIKLQMADDLTETVMNNPDAERGMDVLWSKDGLISWLDDLCADYQSPSNDDEYLQTSWDTAAILDDGRQELVCEAFASGDDQTVDDFRKGWAKNATSGQLNEFLETACDELDVDVSGDDENDTSSGYERPDLPYAGTAGQEQTLMFVHGVMDDAHDDDREKICEQFIETPLAIAASFSEQASGFTWNQTAAVVGLEQKCGLDEDW